MKLRIGLLDPVHPVLSEKLGAAGHTCSVLDNSTLPEHLAQVDGLVVRSSRVGADMIDAMPRLRFVARVGSGLENIDQAHCKARGIHVLNSPEGNRDSVGELCVGALLAMLKHMPKANSEVHAGLWKREENRGIDLLGRTVGIIGFGQMGSAFAEKLQGFGVHVLAHDKYRNGFGTAHVEEASLERVLKESEVLSLHLPLTAETHHYMDAAMFARLGRPIWLLNTSRGAVLDTAALLDALDAEQVLGAALDVLEYEHDDLSDLDRERGGKILQRLLDHPGVLLTPHVAGVTHEGKHRMADVLAGKILAYLHDEADTHS